MTYNKLLPYLTLVIVFLITACDSEPDRCKEAAQFTAVIPTVQIQRLDRELFTLQSNQEVIAFMNRYPLFADEFLGRQEFRNDSILANRVLRLIQDPHLADTLLQQVQTHFPDELLQEQFGKAFQGVLHYFPDFKPPVIQMAVTGLANDMYISDSLIIIGLDYYLGNHTKYRPLNIPEFILRRYTPDHLVPNVMLFISQQFNNNDPKDKTMLADMVYYGKSFYFMQKVLPCTPDSLIIGYTQEELQDSKDNAPIIWANFIQNKLLYETSHQTKIKFLGERPKTVEIGTKCPGRIGMWVGWEIVKAYTKKKGDTDLLTLMKQTNAAQLFADSQYKPKGK